MDDQADSVTPTPHASLLDQGGGGTPNGRAVVTTCPQIAPVQISTPEVSKPTETDGPGEMCAAVELMAALLPATAVDDADLVPLETRWNGELTKASIRRLKDAVRAPGFDQEKAALVLTLIGDGLTLTRACETAQVRRSVIRAWARLEPDFAELLSTLETELGAYHRDQAAEETDPAMMRAKLALASAYDRRISKGESETSVVQGINVTVNW